jgi:hypothetical protein
MEKNGPLSFIILFFIHFSASAACLGEYEKCRCPTMTNVTTISDLGISNATSMNNVESCVAQNEAYFKKNCEILFKKTDCLGGNPKVLYKENHYYVFLENEIELSKACKKILDHCNEK